MSPRRRRMLWIAGALAALALATFFVVQAFRENLVFYYTPTEVFEGKAPKERAFRIGGLVEAGTLQRAADGMSVSFVVTDTAREINVHYRGILPDLFKEGRGAVVQGRLNGVDFIATEVLAKHDENYMPPEAKAAIDAAHQQSGMRK